MTGKKRIRNKPNTFYRKANKFPYMRSKLDFDYIHKLNDEEKRWLSDFCLGMYQSGNTLPTEMQREAWRNFKTASNDLYSRGEPFNNVQELPPADVWPDAGPGSASDIEDELIDRIDANRARERETTETTDEKLLKALFKRS